MGEAPPPTRENTTIAVIGAGIIGVNCALALAKEGFRVTVIDRVDPGEGCSFGNAGILADWAFVPVFGPETLRSVPGYLMDPLGPLTIRWTRLPRLLPWLLRMLPYATTAQVKRASNALHHLTMGCAEDYAAFAAEAGAPELVRQDPVLHVYDRESDFLKTNADYAVRARYGLRYDVLDHDSLRDLEPALAERFKWGHALISGGTTTNPGRLVKALAQSFIRHGGTFHKAEVRNLTRKSGDDGEAGFIIGTDTGPMEANRLVIAAGAHSHQLARMLDERFPLGTERGYHALIAEPGVEVRYAVSWKVREFYATPMEMGLRLAGTVELAGLDAPPDYRRSQILARQAKALLPGLNTEITSKWMGFRPTLPDSLPVIGPSERVHGLFYAFGHQHIGLTCGPATGRAIARLLKGEPSNVDLEPFRASRFW